MKGGNTNNYESVYHRAIATGMDIEPLLKGTIDKDRAKQAYRAAKEHGDAQDRKRVAKTLQRVSDD